MYPIEAFRETVRKFVDIFERHQIRFHLTGGATGTAYGEPRLTQDIDIVVDPEQCKRVVDSLVASLNASEFLFDEATTRSAIASGGMFQLLDEVEVLKLDVYPREMVPGELDRSHYYDMFDGLAVPLVSLVDAATSKLIWIDKGSHKSRRDLRAIVRKFDEQQLCELHRLTGELGLSDLLSRVLGEADEIE